MAFSEPGEVTGRPPTEVMTSPANRPAAAAGVPHRTPSTSAPDLAGAMLPGTAVVSPLVQPLPLLLTAPVCRSSWLACRRGSALVLSGRRTPRDAGRPIWMRAPGSPAAIRLAI